MLVRFFPVLYGPSMYEVFPLGMVESPLVDPVAAPKQGDEGAPEAWLVFEQHVADGLRDVVSGAELLLITWLDRAARDVQLVHPGPRQSRDGVRLITHGTRPATVPGATTKNAAVPITAVDRRMLTPLSPVALTVAPAARRRAGSLPRTPCNSQLTGRVIQTSSVVSEP